MVIRFIFMVFSTIFTSFVDVEVDVEAEVGRESFEVMESDLLSKRSRRELNVLCHGSPYPFTAAKVRSQNVLKIRL